jgi:hypothetical protein
MKLVKLYHALVIIAVIMAYANVVVLRKEVQKHRDAIAGISEIVVYLTGENLTRIKSVEVESDGTFTDPSSDHGAPISNES